MIRVLIVCAFVIYGTCLNHLGSHLKQQVTDEQFYHFVQEHGYNSSVQACPHFEEDMKTVSAETKECLNKYQPNTENLCRFVSHEFTQCVKAPIDLLRRCLPSKSKNVPQLLVDMLLALLGEICISKGSELLELTQPCITHTLTEKDDNKCADLLAKILIEAYIEYPTKEEVCEFHKTYGNCLHERLNESCSSSITKKNFFKFYDAIKKPCKK